MAKEKMISVHVKITETDFLFLTKFKKQFSVSMQKFIEQATKEKIDKLKNS